MPRPRRAMRPKHVNISLPEDVYARMILQLYSPLEGKVPHGAISDYLTELVRKDLERTKV